MSKATKKWLAAATALVFVGLILFLVAFAANEWDFTAFSTRKYETNTYDVTEDFTDITIKTDTADVVLLPSEDGKCRVVAFEDTEQKHTVTVDGDALTVSVTDDYTWHAYIGINFTSPKITVYLPQTVYRSLLVKNDTGDVRISKELGFEEVNVTTSTGCVTLDGCSAENVEITTSTGDVVLSSVSIAGELKTRGTTGDTRLTDITAGSMSTVGSTGSLSLTRVRITNALSVKRNTGDVCFNASDAGSILVKTSTGDVTGTLLTKKQFLTETSTGDVSVPRSESGGRCEIKTDTGDINIRIQE